jgi:hypothetical protein
MSCCEHGVTYWTIAGYERHRVNSLSLAVWALAPVFSRMTRTVASAKTASCKIVAPFTYSTRTREHDCGY